MITTAISVVLIIWGAILDYDLCKDEHKLPTLSLENYVLAIGTFFFSYGNFITIKWNFFSLHCQHNIIFIVFILAKMAY